MGAPARFSQKFPSRWPPGPTPALAAGALRPLASATACAITVATSAAVRAFGLGICALLVPPPAPPPHPASTAAKTAINPDARNVAALIAAVALLRASRRPARLWSRWRARQTADGLEDGIRGTQCR